MPEKIRLLSRGKVPEVYKRLSLSRAPEPELEFKDAFQLLIAVLLSAQCTDKSVNKVTRELWRSVHSPGDFLAMGQERLEEAIHSLGFYRMKARHVIELCRILVERHGGEVPGTFQELTALPGVGVKTANVVLNLWFGMPTIPVDTHVFRVSRRIGLSDAATPEETEAVLERITPAKYAKDAHHYLLLHGRYVCKARKPECGNCPLDGICRKNGVPV